MQSLVLRQKEKKQLRDIKKAVSQIKPSHSPAQTNLPLSFQDPLHNSSLFLYILHGLALSSWVVMEVGAQRGTLVVMTVVSVSWICFRLGVLDAFPVCSI